MTNQNEDELYLRLLGKRVRAIREVRGLSQESLAFACGLHRTYIGAVERGERNITILNLRKIAIALDMSISQILLFEEKNNDSI